MEVQPQLTSGFAFWRHHWSPQEDMRGGMDSERGRRQKTEEEKEQKTEDRATD